MFSQLGFWITGKYLYSKYDCKNVLKRKCFFMEIMFEKIYRIITIFNILPYTSSVEIPIFKFL